MPQADERRELDGRILRSSGWVALSWGGRNLLSMLALLVLVRLLEPSAFGLFAVASTIVLVLQAVQESGVGSALIYKRGDLDRAASSAFVFSAAAGAVFALALFAAAPLVALGFGIPGATNVVRAMSLLVLIRGFSVGPGALLERDMDFRSRTKGELGAGFAQVAASIGLALAGFGVWSLVAGQVLAAVVQTVVFWRSVTWRPRLRLVDWGILRELMRYGRYISAGNLVGIVNKMVDSLVVGRVLGAGALGLYTVIFRLADLPTSVIGYVVGRVMFPAYAQLRDEPEAFRRAFVQTLQRVALFALPIAVGLFVAAQPLVLTLLGRDWLPGVPALRILAVYTVVRGFASPCGTVFQASGRPHLVPLWALPQTIVFIPALAVLVPWLGVTGAAFATLIAFSSSGIPAFVVTLRLLHLGLAELGRALAAPLLCTALAGGAAAALLPVTRGAAPAGALAVLLGTGLAVYTVATAVFARSTIGPMWVSLRGSKA